MLAIKDLKVHLIQVNKPLMNGKINPLGHKFEGTDIIEFSIAPSRTKTRVKTISKGLKQFTFFYEIIFLFSKPPVDVYATLFTLLNQLYGAGVNLEIINFNMFSDDVANELGVDLVTGDYIVMAFEIEITDTLEITQCNDCIELLDC